MIWPLHLRYALRLFEHREGGGSDPSAGRARPVDAFVVTAGVAVTPVFLT
jgi:hypothetical protein